MAGAFRSDACVIVIFNPPLHGLGNKSSVSDIDGLKIFKFYEHPKIRVPIEAMKTTFLWYLYEIALWMNAGSLLRYGFRNRLKCHLLQSNRDGFRDRLKCHLLQSIILWLSLIAVNVIDYHFHLL
jgi:hypothetical protein